MAGEISSALPSAIAPASVPSLDKASGAGAGGSVFSSMLEAAQSSESAANEAVVGMLDGSVDIHDAMIALQRAETTLELSVQIRNKLVSAYQDIMRMPV
jgi:flagellar hook-basal body complex protein FliE